MGKKPVVGLVGLVWAGIALTGCGECCRNTRNTYNPRPQWQMKEGVAPKAPVNDTKPVGMEVPPAKPPESGGAVPAGDGRKMTGPGAMPVSSPGPSDKVNSLRPASDAPELTPATRPVDYRIRETGADLEPLPEPNRKITMPSPPPVRRAPKAEEAPAPTISTPSTPPPGREASSPRQEAAPAPPGELPTLHRAPAGGPPPVIGPGSN